MEPAKVLDLGPGNYWPKLLDALCPSGSNGGGKSYRVVTLAPEPDILDFVNAALQSQRLVVLLWTGKSDSGVAELDMLRAEIDPIAGLVLPSAACPGPQPHEESRGSERGCTSPQVFRSSCPISS